VSINDENEALGWHIQQEDTFTLLTSVKDVLNVLVADIAQDCAISDIAIANDSGGLAGHERKEREVGSTALTDCPQMWPSIVSNAQSPRPVLVVQCHVRNHP